MDTEKIQRMKDILALVDKNYTTPEQVAVVFKALKTSIDTLKETLADDLKSRDAECVAMCKSMARDMESALLACEDRLTSLVSTSSKETLSEAYKALKDEIKDIKDSIKNFDASYLEKKIAEVEGMIPVIKDAVSDTPQEVRDKLESIVPEPEKLSIEAIRDLRKELEEIKKMIKRAGSRHYSLFGGGGGALGGGRIVRSYDLSAQLNGSTKTFQLPAMWRIISVHLSSFPTVLRETTDYTWTPTSVTFTSEIIESASLAAGQTAIIIYAEA